MANIDTYLQTIMSAIYGEQVRGSIHDAIDAINNEVEAADQTMQDFVQGAMDTTLTSTTKPAQGKAVGDAIAEISTELAKVKASENIIDFSNLINGGVYKGVTVTYDAINGTVTLNGTSTSGYVLSLGSFTGAENILLTGGADGGSTSTYFLVPYNASSDFPLPAEDRVTNSTDVKLIELSSSTTYYIGIGFTAGITFNNTTFKPLAYASGALLGNAVKINEVEETVGAINEIIPKWSIFTGVISVCQCGDTLIIDMAGARFYNSSTKSYTSSATGTVTINNTYTSIRYLHFDGNGFTINSYMDENAIVYIYNRYVYPIIDRIIANYRLIQNGYIKSGSEFYINFKRTGLPDAVAAYEAAANDAKVSERGYIYRSAKTIAYKINNMSLSFTLTENTVNIANKKILVIGDSFVARGFIQNFLHDLEPTISFIGTRTTQNYGYKSEGVSGSKLSYFTNADTSPFYINGGLDFGAYLSNNGLDTPDYVVINSAINYGNYDNSGNGNYLQNLTDLINMIRSYSQAIKIYVTYGANYAMEPGSIYGYPSLRHVEVRKCCNSVYSVPNITVIPVDFALIDELDYTYTEIPYFDKTISVLSDCVHPTESTGFKKIANMIYNYLGI